jgi:hypothetical protein
MLRAITLVVYQRSFEKLKKQILKLENLNKYLGL